MNRSILLAITVVTAVLLGPAGTAQALTGSAVTDSLWRVQVGSTTQMRLPGQPIGHPAPSWQLTVPHPSGSLGSSIAQFGTAELYAVEERLRLTQGIAGSCGVHETVLRFTATRAVAFELRLSASVVQAGLVSGASGLAELDLGDDGSIELAAVLGEVRQLTIPISMAPGTLTIRTRTSVQGLGADPSRLAELGANATVLAMFAPAAWQVWGSGCAGSAGVPALAPLGGQRPWAGEVFTVEIRNLPPQTVLGLLGLSRTSWAGLPLPLDLRLIGMPGCTLYSDVQAAWPLSPVSGVATWAVAIPADFGLVGRSFMQQALVLDPNANPFGATVSNSSLATIGSRNL
jgi:hypothetical protein